MRRNEVRALAHAGALLLTVSAVRAAMRYPERDMDGEPPGSSAVEALLVASEAAAEESAVRSTPLAPGERIDPNDASEADLDRLPGIGPALARRIVTARADGPFRSSTDLERVPGLGPQKLASLRDKLAFPANARSWPSNRRTNPDSEPHSWDIERMTAEQLQMLDGIGPTLAGRIVDYRVREGGIESVTQLLEVPGIGPATLERIRRSLELRRAGR